MYRPHPRADRLPEVLAVLFVAPAVTLALQEGPHATENFHALHSSSTARLGTNILHHVVSTVLEQGEGLVGDLVNRRNDSTISNSVDLKTTLRWIQLGLLQSYN